MERSGGESADAASVHSVELPPASTLSPSLRSFLDQEFNSVDDLSRAPALVDRLSSELQSCRLDLSHLQTRLLEKVAIWASHSQSLSSSLNALGQDITDFTVRAEPSVDALGESTLGSGVKNESGRFSVLEKDELVGQLPTLVGEVARVERVRLYAETALRLEALVGDLEDAVESIGRSTPRIQLHRKLANSPDRDIIAGSSLNLSDAMHTLQEIESELFHTIRSWPQWKRLFSAVDLRVDVAVASLRPAAVADYRLKLKAIGWPPPLLAGSLQGGNDEKELESPLLRMNGDTRARFEESFVALSTLQAVQCHRRARQLAQVSNGRLIKGSRLAQFHDHELLWSVDELVVCIGSRAEYHFLKWSEKPDLIFGLAYRIAQQYVESVDIVLQPMLDKERLAGYVIREEWISALVLMVVKYFRSHALPVLAIQLSEELRSQKSSLWLHMVDLAISFDKRMQRLAFQSVGMIGKLDLDAFQENDIGSEPLISKCIDVFAERTEWLNLWAHLELIDAQEKLGMELQKGSTWLPDGTSDAPIGTLKNLETNETRFAQETYRAPQGAEVCMLKMWSLISRCRTLTQSKWQLSFIRFVGSSFIRGYLESLLERCQEAEALTALAGEGAVLKVAMCINAAYFCEQKLREWSEDVFFLNLHIQHFLSADGGSELKDSGYLEMEINKAENLSSLEGSVFGDEIHSLMQFRVEWLQKLVSAVQRAFDGCLQEYLRNKKRWQDENNVAGLAFSNIEKVDPTLPKSGDSQKSLESVGAAMDITISPSLVDALAILQARLNILKESLGEVVFMELWRSLADCLDLFFFNNIVLGGARFSVYGSCQLVRDIKAVFQIFKPFCVRPARFFPILDDTITLHTLPKGVAAALLKNISSTSSWRFREWVEESSPKSLKEYGVRCINPGIAGKVLSHRMLPKI